MARLTQPFADKAAIPVCYYKLPTGQKSYGWVGSRLQPCHCSFARSGIAGKH